MMDFYGLAKTFAVRFLDQAELVTPELIAKTVDDVLLMPQFASNVDRAALIRDLEALTATWIGESTVLKAKDNHEPWLARKKADIEWVFWRRYESYLQDSPSFAPIAVQRLDESTDKVLDLLVDPQLDRSFDRRGMVVGQVQSGKTSNYTALICKALDAGYKLIVVLAGLHDNLRSQTQLRIDECIIGRDSRHLLDNTREHVRVGVGEADRRNNRFSPPITPLTTSAQKGDFSKSFAQQVGIVPGGNDPLILVIKKHASIFDNLNNWLLQVAGVPDAASGRRMVKGVPLLVIDDEADNASINTNPLPKDDDGNVLPDHQVSRINGCIRKLLASFDRSAYVGYTATPFANIFIHDNARAEQFEEDIFPRDFILNLPAPSTHFGPADVFGIDGDPGLGIEEKDGLDVCRTVDDHEHWVPQKHNKQLVPEGIPESVQNAIRSFVLVCAARAARGQRDVHNSMLLHVTRFTDVQARVAEIVKAELTALQRRLRYGEGDTTKPVISELKELWEKDFVPTTTAVRATMNDPSLTEVSWDQVQQELVPAAMKIQVKTINGSAKDALDYVDHKEGLSVIAIGGDKLSRGLTLEGLSVSYFLRASKMYDTLMQMGRWFGYRPGYVDLCRLYTTDELMQWYRHITFATEELRREFERMVAVGGTPEDYGLRVRMHPAGLVITAANKMRSGTPMQLSYAGSITETIVFPVAEARLQQNFRAAATLLDSQGRPKRTVEHSGTLVWENVSPSAIIDFFLGFYTHPDSPRANAKLLADYVKEQQGVGELKNWTVALVTKNDGERTGKVGSHEVNLIEREPLKQSPSFWTIRRLVNPADEAIDLSEPQRADALRRTIEEWHTAKTRAPEEQPPDRPAGPIIRTIRPPQNGLLLIYPLFPKTAVAGMPTDLPVIGFAVSFPGSKNARPISYAVNNVFWEQEFGQP